MAKAQLTFFPSIEFSQNARGLMTTLYAHPIAPGKKFIDDGFSAFSRCVQDRFFQQQTVMCRHEDNAFSSEVSQEMIVDQLR